MLFFLSPQALRTMGPAAWIREGWRRAGTFPGGRRLFNLALGFVIPYTGSMGAEVLTIDRGHSRVQLVERRALRNHLDSIHAIALANLAELTGNLALVGALPEDARFIVTKLAIEYKKKARGRLIAECRCEPPSSNERREYALDVTIRDANDVVVATAVLTTLVGSNRPERSN